MGNGMGIQDAGYSANAPTQNVRTEPVCLSIMLCISLPTRTREDIIISLPTILPYHGMCIHTHRSRTRTQGRPTVRIAIRFGTHASMQDIGLVSFMQPERQAGTNNTDNTESNVLYSQ